MLFTIINQPKGVRVGDRIMQLLDEAKGGEFTKFTMVAAFVKRAGVSRISKEIAAARANGTTICSIAGIDHGGSSAEGLSDLYDLSDEMYVVHSTQTHVTFHPKAYVFEGPARGVLIIGSSNLTCGGLFTNMELCAEAEYAIPAEQSCFTTATNWCQSLQDTKLQHVVRVTKKNLPQILGIVPAEKSITGGPTPGSKGSGSAKGSALFGPGSFPAAPSLPASSKGKGTKSSNKYGAAASGIAPSTTLVSLPAVGGWKQLSPWDVHSTQGPGSMIIPLALLHIFPTLGKTVKTKSGASQAEAPCPLIFVDAKVSKFTAGRFIKYTPAVHQKRKNVENRLAFHDRSINPAGLNKGDILLFETLSGDPSGAILRVTRVQPADPLHAQLESSTTKAFGLIP